MRWCAFVHAASTWESETACHQCWCWDVCAYGPARWLDPKWQEKVWLQCKYVPLYLFVLCSRCCEVVAVLALTLLWSVAAGLCRRLPHPPHACAQRERLGGAGGPPQTHVLHQRGRDHRHPRLRGCGWDVRGLSPPPPARGRKKSREACFSTPAALVCLCRFSGPAAHPAHSGAGQTHPLWGELIHCFSVEAAAEQALHAPGAQLRWVPFSGGTAGTTRLLLSTGLNLNNYWRLFTRWMRWKSPDLSLRLQSVCVKCACSKQTSLPASHLQGSSSAPPTPSPPSWTGWSSATIL